MKKIKSDIKYYKNKDFIFQLENMIKSFFNNYINKTHSIEISTNDNNIYILNLITKINQKLFFSENEYEINLIEKNNKLNSKMIFFKKSKNISNNFVKQSVLKINAVLTDKYLSSKFPFEEEVFWNDNCNYEEDEFN